MRIQHNIPAMNGYRNYSSNTKRLSGNLEKLSSGYKINRAGDDAAGLAVSQKMRLQIAGLDQAQNNAQSGISLIQTAEGALQEVHDMLQRMYTLAEQSANGTYDDGTDRNQLQKEVNRLKTEIERIGKTANFNGIGLFAQYEGSTVKANGIYFAIGAETLNQNLASAANVMKIDGMNLSLASIGLNGASSAITGNISSVNIGQQTSAWQAMYTIQNAVNAVSDMRGTLGAFQNRLEHTINNLSVMEENMTDAESVIRDTDVADEIMAYTKNNILVQSAQAMLAQANQLPQGVLQLLQ